MRHVSFVAVSSLAFALVAACGSSSSSEENGDKGSSGESSSGGGGPNGPLGSSGGPSGSSGGPGETCAAAAKSANRAAVDVIFVIDTSASMGQETEEVKQNINTFAQSIGNTGLDYNVVMIAKRAKSLTASGIAVCVGPPLAGAKCADSAKFHHLNESVGSKNSLSTILQAYSKYSGWLRPDAFKVFIEVTDDNSSFDADEFDEQLLAKAPEHFGDAQKRRYIFNSICGYKRGTAVLSAEKCETAVNTGDQYQTLSALTGGTVDSVCETSYASVFDNIAKGLVTKLGCEFEFPKAADGKQTDPGTLVVTYTPGNGSGAKPLTQVTDTSKCSGTPDGWYYDNPASPAKIIFCPTTCSGPGADTGGKIDVAVGCVAPPPK